MINKIKLFLIGIIVFLILGCFYGMLLVKRDKIPEGGLEVFTYPYRAYKWLKHNEPISIPEIPKDTLQYFYGSRIQRTMSLLESSNENRRNRVKILFYGQSIVAGLNTESIIEKLRNRYPYAKIDYDNRAVGGFSAPNLARLAVHDLYPYYPDLLIFHVYGGESGGELERIIYNTRKHTTSEILLFNHHYRWKEDSLELKEATIKDDISSDFWRFIAQKYGCELVDVRREWKKYINTHPNVDINTLMGDKIHSNVHPNREGKKLLELLLLRHLRYNPISFDISNRGWFNEIRCYDIRRLHEEKMDEVVIVGKYRTIEESIILDSGIVELTFTGNKIELLSQSVDEAKGSAEILIDGQKPSMIPSLYFCSRPSESYMYSRPALKRVSLGSQPVTEKWKLKITKIDHHEKFLEFEIFGDKTGFDGKGSNKARFISNSRRITIESFDFFIFESDSITKNRTPLGFEINWEVKPLHLDRIVCSKNDSTYLIAQGLENTRHRIQIIIDGNNGSFPIRSIRVYSPPLKD